MIEWEIKVCIPLFFLYKKITLCAKVHGTVLCAYPSRAKSHLIENLRKNLVRSQLPTGTNLKGRFLRFNFKKLV